MAKRNRSPQTKTSRKTFSDAIHSLPSFERKFLRVAEEAGANGVIYSDIMQAVGMGQSAAATARCNLLVKGKLFLNGDERPSPKGYDCQVVVAKEYATEKAEQLTNAWLRERNTTAAKKEKSAHDAERAAKRIVKYCERLLDPDKKTVKEDVKMIQKIAEWVLENQ